MNLKARPTLVAICLTMGCAGGVASPSGPQPVTVTLTASAQNAGKIGQVTLVAHGQATEMLFFISGVPPGTTAPAHVYTYVYPGSCSNLGEKPAFAMTRRTVLGDHVPYQENKLWRTIPMSLDDLTSSDYAIVVRSSPADGFREMFCGDIKHAA
jgi:Cu/Zn superoxide dismutase